ncbi:MAG: hypothetical protein ACTHU0_37390 [Kofleriaceae bacterium]
MPPATSEFGYFNADQHAAALEPPVLILGGLRYEGRLLSIEEWLPFAEEAGQLRTGTRAAWAAFARRYLRAVFPRRRFRVWAPDPVQLLMAQPWATVEEALDRFFVLQARAMSPRVPTTETSGTGSLDRTPPSPSAGAASAPDSPPG